MEFKKWDMVYDFSKGFKKRSISIVEENSFKSICEITMSDSEGGGSNALLISKAPEMLEMLIEVLENKSDIDYKKVEQLIKEATELYFQRIKPF